MKNIFLFSFIVYSMGVSVQAENVPSTIISTSEVSMTNQNAQRAVVFFNKLGKDTLNLVNEFYDANADFQDPIHKLKGAEAVRAYYAGLYQNVESIRFVFHKIVSEKDTHLLVWTMYLKTPKLNSGKEFSVDGNSVITFGGAEGKAIYHRDYFDMGEFVYERVPVLQSIIKFIKSKMSGK